MLTLTLTLPELPLTADQFASLPDPEGFRLELADGEIVVMAAAQMIWHSDVARRIENLLREQGKITVREVGVVVGHRDVPVPDVSVFGKQPTNQRLSQVPASDVSCVVEVVSPESRTRDTVVKPQKYAAAGIPEMWLVTGDEDPSDATISIFKLTPAGSYGLAATHKLCELEAA